MSVEYYRNYLSGQKILEYSPETGEHQEVWSSTLPEEEWNKGFYVRLGDDFFGFYASSEGPICFKNRSRYRLQDENCRIELIMGERQNRFALYWGDEEQFAVTYQFPGPKDVWDEWATLDEDYDFFLWLLNSWKDRSSFISYYTV